MRRSTAGTVLVVVTAAGLLSQCRLLPQDEGVLVQVGERPVDVAGRLLGLWQQTVRYCGDVTVLASGSPRWRAAQRALAGYSPPASLAVRPVQMLAWGDGAWLLVELRWDGPGQALDPAIVPLLRQGVSPAGHVGQGGDSHYQVQPAGVWSGDTGPWFAPVFIRRFLARRVPALPAALRQCLDPQVPPFNR